MQKNGRKRQVGWKLGKDMVYPRAWDIVCGKDIVYPVAWDNVCDFFAPSIGNQRNLGRAGSRRASLGPLVVPAQTRQKTVVTLALIGPGWDKLSLD
ncbi:hypothetical protein AMTR_s00006p00266910 [Amborella trichopoda]|uniref:Uncharacterized protein n=1 Tax=Amborella trichopoda TaxID=13333 RepID=W1PFQ3_AMBTC|nr:hypothetical protein AMTR_s00006p00266910 [Amborella trichopoda]